MRTIGVGLLLLTIESGTVGQAQELTFGVSAYTPFGIDDLDGELPVSAEARVTIPISDKFAVEPSITAGSDRRRVRPGLEGFAGPRYPRCLRVLAMRTYSRPMAWRATIRDPRLRRLSSVTSVSD